MQPAKTKKKKIQNMCTGYNTQLCRCQLVTHLVRLLEKQVWRASFQQPMFVITTCQTQASLRFPPPSAITADSSHQATD